ncbi:hypothetical protein DVV91_10075 [Clostridium botulinum]|uniref:hypothetical protein n=1 Tax=Clostridium botulinum TaxID=1491 RepID=UPI001966D7D0|nr:hypothetical protein [Clostridium botulinum]MBN1074688.1 hypothetical protein [Clostridium botulinum]
MKLEEYNNINTLNYTYTGDDISRAIKTILKNTHNICSYIKLNKNSLIQGIEAINSLKNEEIIEYEVDEDIPTGYILYFNNRNVLIGKSNCFPMNYDRYFEEVKEEACDNSNRILRAFKNIKKKFLKF